MTTEQLRQAWDLSLKICGIMDLDVARIERGERDPWYRDEGQAEREACDLALTLRTTLRIREQHQLRHYLADYPGRCPRGLLMETMPKP